VYNLANDVWDSYFRHKREARSLRREATNSPVVRVPMSVGAKEVTGRKLRAQVAGRSNSFQKQNNGGEGNARYHPMTNINYSRYR